MKEKRLTIHPSSPRVVRKLRVKMYALAGKVSRDSLTLF
jgi:hypothetical protein